MYKYYIYIYKFEEMNIENYKLKKYTFVPESWYLVLDLFKYLFPEEPRFKKEFPNIYEIKKGEQE